MSIETSPIIHIAIDVQTKFYDDLCGDRRKDFPAAVRQFADDLRLKGIPTLWVANTGSLYEEYSWRFYAAQSAILLPIQASPNTPRVEYDLKLHKVDKGDFIYAKNDENAFLRSLLGVFLKQKGVQKALFSGMNTSACVARTVEASVAFGVQTFVVRDLLADASNEDYEPKNGGSSQWHHRMLISRVSPHVLSKIKVIQSKEALRL